MKILSGSGGLVLLLSALLTGPASAELARDPAAAPSVKVQERPTPISAAAPPALTERDRLSQREAKAPGLQKFKGGDDGPDIYIGIGGGTLAVILLVVVIVLLIH